MDQGVDVTDVGGADDLGGQAPGPFGGMVPDARVRLALQHRGALELVAGEVLGPALHRFVPGRTQESRQGESLGQMLLVVPAIELLLSV